MAWVCLAPFPVRTHAWAQAGRERELGPTGMQRKGAGKWRRTGGLILAGVLEGVFWIDGSRVAVFIVSFPAAT